MGRGGMLKYQEQTLRWWGWNSWCDVLEIGSHVPWKPTFYNVGENINCNHNAETNDAKELPFAVAVRDQKIVGIIPVDCTDEQTLFWDEAQAKLNEQFGPPQEPPRDLWPEVAWEAEAWREEVRRKRMAEPGYSFTREKMREHGFMRMMLGPWSPRPDLTEIINERIQQEFVPCIGWKYGADMLASAVHYRGERLLTEAGLWQPRSADQPLSIRSGSGEGQITLMVQELGKLTSANPTS